MIFPEETFARYGLSQYSSAERYQSQTVGQLMWRLSGQRIDKMQRAESFASQLLGPTDNTIERNREGLLQEWTWAFAVPLALMAAAKTMGDSRHSSLSGRAMAVANIARSLAKQQMHGASTGAWLALDPDAWTRMLRDAMEEARRCNDVAALNAAGYAVAAIETAMQRSIDVCWSGRAYRAWSAARDAAWASHGVMYNDAWEQHCDSDLGRGLRASGREAARARAFTKIADDGMEALLIAMAKAGAAGGQSLPAGRKWLPDPLRGLIGSGQRSESLGAAVL